MTGFQKLFGKAITISAALSMTAGLALAADGTFPQTGLSTHYNRSP